MKESITALIITVALGLGIIAATGHMQRMDNLEREVAALEREIAARQAMLNDMALIIEAQQRRALEVESVFSASQLLEFFAHDLAEAGAVVHVSAGP